MRRATDAAGFTLVETLVALMAAGLAVGVILSSAWAAERGIVSLRETARARGLADEIREEIAALAPSAAPAAYERPAPIEGADGWTRRVRIRSVDPARPAREKRNSGLLEITLEISRGGRLVESLVFLRAVES